MTPGIVGPSQGRDYELPPGAQEAIVAALEVDEEDELPPPAGFLPGSVPENPEGQPPPSPRRITRLKGLSSQGPIITSSYLREIASLKAQLQALQCEVMKGEPQLRSQILTLLQENETLKALVRSKDKMISSLTSPDNNQCLLQLEQRLSAERRVSEKGCCNVS